MSVRRSLAWMILSQGGNFVLQFGSTVVLARLLTPYEMGIFTAALAVVGILSVFQAFGVSLFVIREARLNRDQLVTAFTVNAVISILLALAIVGLSTVGGILLREDGVRTVMLLLAPVPLLSIPQFLPASLLERAGNFRAIAMVNLAKVCVGTVVTVGLALSGFSYHSLAYGAVASAAASSAAFVIVGWQHQSYQVSLRDWRPIMIFCSQQFAIQGINEIAGRLSEFLLGRLVGLAGLGLYGRAVSLNSAIWTNIHVVVGRVVLVDLADRHRRGADLRQAYLHILNLTTATLWPAFLGLAILSGPLIRLIYGDAWIAAGPILAALSVAALFLVAITMTWELFAVCHRSHIQARLEVVRASFGLTVFTGGAFLGLQAAAMARVVEAIFSVILYRTHIENMTGATFRDFASIYRCNFAITLATCSPAFILMIVFDWSPFVTAGEIGIAVLLSAVIWIAMIRLTNHALTDELDRGFALLRHWRPLRSR